MSIVLSWQKSQKTELVKALPRSVMILLGTPKRLRTGASEDRWMVAPGCDE
jgi:hypothetical protein